MKAVEVLKLYHLKRTSCREGIINVAMEASKALSENEIRERLSGNYDRTTFYRSFKTLEKHNILHKIVVSNQLVRYAINNTTAKEVKHVHFYCNQCNTVKCLNNIPVQKYTLPEGYSQTETEVLIKGMCVKCKRA
ncbi:MAG: Fur family transcriptional regulator [Paludibacteraceae bacterium]